MIDIKLISELEAALDAFALEYDRATRDAEKDIDTLDEAYLNLVRCARRVVVFAKASKPKPAPAVPQKPSSMKTRVEVAPKFSGDACPNCGQFMLVTSGTCKTCRGCGWNAGCG